MGSGMVVRAFLAFNASVAGYISKLNRKTREMITYMTDILTLYHRAQISSDDATLIRPIRSITTEVNTSGDWPWKAKVTEAKAPAATRRADSVLYSRSTNPKLRASDSYSSHLQMLYNLSLHALFPASEAGSSLSVAYVSVSRSISSNFTTLVRFKIFHPRYITNMMGNST